MDFRFKIRVWFLDDVESVCNQCSNGCNIVASRSNNRVYRYMPRRNDAVNDTWMCDKGRLSYRRVQEGRLERARVRGSEVGYEAAVRAAGEALRAARESGGRIVGVASAFAANEDLFVLRELLEALGAEAAGFTVAMGAADELLVKAEKAPNAAGARALGFSESASVGRAAVGIVLGHATPAADLAEVETTILIDSHDSELAARAAIALPARSFAEREGSFTNHARRVQRFHAVVEPVFEAWAEGEVLRQLAVAAGLDGWGVRFDPHAVSKRLAETVPAFAGLDLASLGDHGLELG